MKKLTITIAALVVALHCIAQEELTVNLENDKVAPFLKNVKYSYASGTRIASYAKNLVAADEQPRPAVIELGEAAGEGTFVIVRNTVNENETYTVGMHEGDLTATVYNLIPQQRYEYNIVKNDGNGGETIASGFINTEGNLRMLNLNTLHNVRDIGGWTTTEGERTQYGLIYRGSELHGNSNNAAAEDIAEMHRLGALAELDLRGMASPPTVSGFGDDVPYLNLYMQDQQSGGMLPIYDTEIREAFDFILDNLRHKRSVYVHCTYGADRTGTVIGLIESCIGLTPDAVYKDYELSTFSSFVGLRTKSNLQSRLLTPIGYTSSTKSLKQCARDYMTDNMGISQQDIDDITAILLGTYEYPEDGEQTGICLRKPTISQPEAYFDLSGRMISCPAKGISIVRKVDGTVVKRLK